MSGTLWKGGFMGERFGWMKKNGKNLNFIKPLKYFIKNDIQLFYKFNFSQYFLDCKNEPKPHRQAGTQE